MYLFQKSVGILSLLDEETKLQQGTDEKFVQKVTSNHSDSGIIMKSTTSDPVFGIHHFAGQVSVKIEAFQIYCWRNQGLEGHLELVVIVGDLF